MGDRPWQERYRGLLNRLRVRADGGDWDCRQAADRIESLHDTVERLHALVGEDADRVPLTAEIERLRAERNMAEAGRLSAVAWGARMEFRAIEAECALANAKRDAK